MRVIAEFTQSERRQARRLLLASLVVLGVGLWPLFSSHVLYLDDMGRVLDGYFGWNINARPAAEGVMRLLGFGDALVNIAPLPQLVAWAIAAGMSLAWWRWVPGLRPMVYVLGNALIWLTPFTLQNFTYVFDSLPMTVALASGVLASLLLRQPLSSYPPSSLPSLSFKHRWRRLMAATALLLVALCSYQPALNAFLVLSLLEALFSTTVRRSWQLLFQRAGVVIVALVVYLPLSRVLVAGEYSQQHGRMLDPGDVMALLGGVQSNLQAAATAWRGGLDHASLVFSLVLLMGLAMTLGAGLWSRRGEGVERSATWRERGLKASFERLSRGLWLLLLVPALWGPMLLLAEPVFHSRTLVAWGPLLGGALMLGLAGQESLRRTQRYLVRMLLTLAVLLLIRQWLIFAAWSNALTAQQHYEAQLAQRIVMDASTLGLPLRSVRDSVTFLPQSPLPVLVLGKAPIAPLAIGAQRHVPAVKQNLIAAFTPNNYWAVVRLRAAGASAVTLLRDPSLKAQLAERKTCPAIVSASVVPLAPYQLWQADGVWVIDFREKAQQCPSDN